MPMRFERWMRSQSKPRKGGRGSGFRGLKPPAVRSSTRFACFETTTRPVTRAVFVVSNHHEAGHQSGFRGSNHRKAGYGRGVLWFGGKSPTSRMPGFRSGWPVAPRRRHPPRGLLAGTSSPKAGSLEVQPQRNHGQRVPTRTCGPTNLSQEHWGMLCGLIERSADSRRQP